MSNTNSSLPNTSNPSQTSSNPPPFSYHSLLFDTHQNQTSQNLTVLHTYVQQTNPSFKVLEDEMIKVIREVYDQLPTTIPDQTPLDFLLNRLIELHLIGRARNINTLAHRSFLKVVSIVINEYKRDFTEKSKAIGLQYWTKIDPLQLKPFLSIFNIAEEVNHEEMLPKVRQLRSQNKSAEAVNYIIALNLQSHFDTKDMIRMFIGASKFKEAAALVVSDSKLQQFFMDEMMATRNSSKAADFIKDFGKEITDFPELLETLQKGALRFHMKNDHWMKFEEKFYTNHPQMLGYFVEALVNEGRFDQALSIIKRHDLVNLGYIKNKYVLDVLKPYLKEKSPKEYSYLENELFSKDDYLPTEKILPIDNYGPKYALLVDFGLDPVKDILFVDNCEGFEEIMKDIVEAGTVGIDTEHRFNTIKLENWPTSVIQISTRTKVYIFDLLKIGKTEEYIAFFEALLENKDIMKLGQTLLNDLKTGEDKSGPVINNYVDLQKVYKSYNNQKKSSLSAITEDLLNLGLSKCEQLSDWNRRPLRKAQIHYAAMDAFMLIILYEKLKDLLENNGVNMDKFKENVTVGGTELERQIKKMKMAEKEVF